MYFEDFPKFAYDFEIAGEKKVILITDITRNVRFRKELLANISLWDEYDIVDDETPEIIAEKIYGNANYHWIIMLLNERFDYIADFPLSYPKLVRYVEDKYGVANKDIAHHYESAKGFVVNSDTPGATPVSNLQYEERINESKRRIKIITPAIVDKVIEQFGDLL
jgi:hypothetical protein